MNLFSSINQEVIQLQLPDMDMLYYPSFFSEKESDRLFKSLNENIQWQQDIFRIYGKEIPLPRLTALYGDAAKTYTYSNILMQPHSWNEDLLEIKQRIEAVAKVSFSTVLLNLYRTGNDSNAWHADDEKELGQNPIIGSVSFGASRILQFKHKKDKTLKTKIELQHGSFLLMKGATQHHWLHQIPKTAKSIAPRINLTFRIIVT
jgi:alkylated DNA repair dioxygenase AlkB